MKHRNLLVMACVGLTVLGLGGCSDARDKLGLSKQAPDEFKVLKRAPLAMPPDYALRPPTPGAPRPQEQLASEEAAQTVFGASAPGQQTTPSSSAGLLLQQAGADNADPSIRQKISQEREELNASEETVAKKLLGMSGIGGEEPQGTIVDAKAEAERLKKNAEEGKSVLDGETPIVEE